MGATKTEKRLLALTGLFLAAALTLTVAQRNRENRDLYRVTTDKIPTEAVMPALLVLNLNTATAAQLEGLPKIGPALAQRIVDWREENGGFTALEQIQEVQGIGEGIFAEIRDNLTIGEGGGE
ncbi:MAG: ComEA family DNA-binding protein [Oscillospiraceae bacterium]